MNPARVDCLRYPLHMFSAVHLPLSDFPAGEPVKDSTLQRCAEAAAPEVPSHAVSAAAPQRGNNAGAGLRASTKKRPVAAMPAVRVPTIALVSDTHPTAPRKRTRVRGPLPQAAASPPNAGAEPDGVGCGAGAASGGAGAASDASVRVAGCAQGDDVRKVSHSPAPCCLHSSCTMLYRARCVIGFGLFPPPTHSRWRLFVESGFGGPCAPFSAGFSGVCPCVSPPGSAVNAAQWVR